MSGGCSEYLSVLLKRERGEPEYRQRMENGRKNNLSLLMHFNDYTKERDREDVYEFVSVQHLLVILRYILYPKLPHLGCPHPR